MRIFESGHLAILLTIYLNSVSGQQNAVVSPFDIVDPTPVAPASNSCQVGDMGPKCADCNTLMLCIGDVQTANQLCSTIDRKRPYCVDDTCAASTTQLCASKTFKCTAEGRFPDPEDCTRYYLCDQAGGSAYPYKCPPGLTYDSKSGQCTRGPCQTIDCSKSPNRYIVYPPDASFLAYCKNTQTEEDIVLFRCPDPKNLEYDQNTLKCVYKCSGEGRFADRLDCHAFYECYLEGTTLKAKRQLCPIGYCYDQKPQLCVKQANCTNEQEQSQLRWF